MTEDEVEAAAELGRAQLELGGTEHVDVIVEQFKQRAGTVTTADQLLRVRGEDEGRSFDFAG